MARIGQLRERVTIQTPVKVSTTGGGSIETWSDVTTVSARVLPMQGREMFAREQLHEEITHKVTIRHRSDVTTDQRLVWGSRVLNIESAVNLDERRRYLTMTCREGAPT